MNVGNTNYIIQISYTLVLITLKNVQLSFLSSQYIVIDRVYGIIIYPRMLTVKTPIQ